MNFTPPSPATPAAVLMREWARGTYADEAGVEVLIRSGLAEHHGLGAAWSEEEGLDVDALVRAAAAPMSGGERRLVAIALSLLTPTARPVELTEVLTGLDREATDLVLAACAHAAGSNGDRAPRYDGPGSVTGLRPASPLHPWPTADERF